MLSPLTKEQRMKVEENMGLVGKVIQDCVRCSFVSGDSISCTS